MFIPTCFFLVYSLVRRSPSQFEYVCKSQEEENVSRELDKKLFLRSAFLFTTEVFRSAKYYGENANLFVSKEWHMYVYRDMYNITYSRYIPTYYYFIRVPSTYL